MNLDSSSNRRFAAIGLIGVGLFFLASQLFNISIAGALWPLLVILPGLPFLYFAFNGGRNQAGLIYPGVIVTGTGLLLFYQNIFNHWESWAYAWALIPVFIGLAMMFEARRGNSSQQNIRVGRMMATIGMAAFVGMGLLFELLIFNNIFSGVAGWLLPIGLIGAGAFLLRGRSGRSADGSPVEKPKFAAASSRLADEKPKRTVDLGADYDDLRRQIDAALNEDTPDDPRAPQQV
jgi:hypothetical protein